MKEYKCPNGCGFLKPVLHLLKRSSIGEPEEREWILECSVCGEEFLEQAFALGEFIPPRLKAKNLMGIQYGR